MPKLPRFLLLAAALPAFAAFAPGADIVLSGTQGWPALTGTNTYTVTGGGSGVVTLSDTLPLGLANTFAYTDSLWVTNATTVGVAQSGVTLRAAGGGWAVVTQTTANNHLFTINESVTDDIVLNLDKLIITGGNRNNNGGAFALAGTGTQSVFVTINGDVVFKDNVAGGSQGRGGVFYVNKNSLKFTGNAVFDSNRAGLGATGIGGAIILYTGAGQKLLFEKNAVFLNNISANTAGAIQNGNDGEIIVNGTAVFIGNKSGDAVATAQHGGAILLGANNNPVGGLIWLKDGAWFENNAATGVGGAMQLYGSSTLTIGGDAVFISNTSGYKLTNGSGGAISASKAGGAATGPITFQGSSTFSGNVSMGIGGAIYLENPPLLKFSGAAVFTSNTAGAGGGIVNGGAIAIGAASGTVSFGGAATFSGNHASGTGGALAFGYTLQKLEFAGDTVFEDNIAGYGVATGTAHGGGLWLGAAAGAVTFGGSTRFSGNEATWSGGGLYAAGGNTFAFTKSVTFENNKSGLSTGSGVRGYGGAIALEGGASALTFNLDDGAVARFEGNQTSQYGGAIYHYAAAGAGDLVFSGSAAHFAFLHNVVATSMANGGGAIHIRNNNLVVADDVTDFVMRGNFAGDTTRNASGGAIVLVSAGRLLIGGSTAFTGNQAASNGGALAATAASTYDGGVIALTGAATVADNMAFYDGGAIHYTGATVNTIRIATERSGGISFTGNTAGRSGGAIFLDASSIGSGIVLDAQQADITFSGNKHGATVDRSVVDAEAIRATGAGGYMTAIGGTPNDIFFSGSDQTLALSATTGRSVSLLSGIANTDTAGLVTTVTKSGSGAVRFGAVSDINANTTVQAGDFLLVDDATYGRAATGTFTVQAGAVLGGSGTLRADTLALADGAILRAGGTLAFDVTNGVALNHAVLSGTGAIGGVATATASRVVVGSGPHAGGQALAFGGALTLDNATVSLGVFGGTDSDTFSANSLTLTGTTAFDFNEFVTGTYTLLSTTGGITASGTWLTQVNGQTVSNSRWVSNYSLIGGNTALQAILIKYGSKVLGWNLAGGGDWDLASANWSDGDGFLAGDAVQFSNVTGTVGLAASRLSASQMTVSGTGTVVFAGTGGITTDAALWDAASGAAPGTVLGRLDKSGAGTLVLANTGSNHFSGGIIIAGGALVFDRADQLGAAAISFANTGTLGARAGAGALELDNTLSLASGARAALDVAGGTLSLHGALSGNSGTLAKTGTGALVLDADNSAFLAPVLVEAGALDLRGALGGNVAVASGAKFSGTGAVVGGNLDAAPGALLQVGSHGAGATGTLAIGGTLSLHGATLLYDLATSGTPPALAAHDGITATALALGGTNTFDFSTSIVQGDYLLVGAGAVTGFDADNFITFVNGTDYRTGSGRMSVAYSADAAGLRMNATLTASGSLVWSGSTGSTWKANDGAADWQGIDTKFANGDIVAFDSTADAGQPVQRDITVDAAGVVVAEMLVTGTGDYRFAGGAIRGTDNPSETKFADPSGKLIKDGAGTLTLANTGNTFAGGIALLSGTLQGSAASLGANVITTRAGSALVLGQASGAATYTGTVAGESAASIGDVYKTGTGSLAVQGLVQADVFEHLAGTVTGESFISAGQYNLRGGTLAIGGTLVLGRGMAVDSGGVLAGQGRVRLGAGGAFVHSGTIKIGKAAGLAGMGTLVIEGDYVGNGGVVALATVLNAGGAETQTDLLHITGAMSGTARLGIANDGGLGDNTGTGAGDGIKVVAVDGAIGGTFSLAEPVTAGVFDYGLVRGDGGFYLQAVAPVPEIPAAGALPGVAALAGQAGFDSVRERLAALRAAPAHERGGWWLRDVYDQTELKTGPFEASRFHTNLVQVGLDTVFAGEGAAWTVGAFYTNTDMAGRVAGIRAQDDAKGAGVYVLMQRGRLHASLLLQADDSIYRVFARDGEFRTRGWSSGASLEAGYALAVSPRLGTLEAEAALTGQKLATGTGWDDRDRKYAFDDGESLLARAGLRWHRFFDLDGGEWLQPWLRAGVSHEFANRYDMRVQDAATPAHAATYVFENDLRGGQLDLSAGLGWGLTEQFSFNFSFAFITGKARESCSATGGVRYVW
ncbi:autotransporter outer membrane beta-barrel domain-containing protein [Termitidicoccus mucosus]